uniref:Metalloprotease TIKI n=1 Tax=Oryzias latipes TaxID=8090 RepID=A0A3P9L2U0_ORYLA
PSSGKRPPKHQSELNSFLWQLKRPPPYPPSYLFGTIHVPYTRVWDFIPNSSKQAFHNSNRVFFELDLTDPMTISKLTSCQLLPHGENLQTLLPRDLYRRLKRHLDYVKHMMPYWMTADQRGRGLYADYLFNAIAGNWERKRPVWVMLMVNSLTEWDVRSRGTPVLDLFLAQEAERMGKITGAVEQVEEQCHPLNGLNFSQVLFALNQTLLQHEGVRAGSLQGSYTTEDLITHYNCGDLSSIIFNHDTSQLPHFINRSLPAHDRVTAQQIDSYFRQELIYKRNERMARRVSALLQRNPNQTYFFAFGAGHFLGNHSVLDILTQEGHEIIHMPADRLRRSKPDVEQPAAGSATITGTPASSPTLDPELGDPGDGPGFGEEELPHILLPDSLSQLEEFGRHKRPRKINRNHGRPRLFSDLWNGKLPPLPPPLLTQTRHSGFAAHSLRFVFSSGFSLTCCSTPDQQPDLTKSTLLHPYWSGGMYLVRGSMVGHQQNRTSPAVSLRPPQRDLVSFCGNTVYLSRFQNVCDQKIQLDLSRT